MEIENTVHSFASTSTQDPSTAPIPYSNHRSKRAIILVILFVIIAVIGIGIYLLRTIKTQSTSTTELTPSTTTQPTSIPDLTNWKTYTSVKYGYSLNYPPDFGFSSYTDQLGHDNILLYPPSPTNASIGISQMDKRADQSFSDWLSSYIKLRDKQTFSPPKSITVDSRSAESLESSIVINGNALQSNIILIQKNDTTIIEIVTNNEAILPTVGQILSNFKFSD